MKESSLVTKESAEQTSMVLYTYEARTSHGQTKNGITSKQRMDKEWNYNQ